MSIKTTYFALLYSLFFLYGIILHHTGKGEIMLLNKNLRVVLPNKGIAFKKTKKDGPKYVYFTTSSVFVKIG